MKRCPNCNRTYTDNALSFCLQDGTPLVAADPAPPPSSDRNAAPQYPRARETSPPPTVPLRPDPPLVNQMRTSPTWSPMPILQPRKRSVWPWVIGGVAIVGFMGLGFLILVLALAGMKANSNNRNSRIVNRNASSGNANVDAARTRRFSDDFSSETWGTGTYTYGSIWYKDDQYHMHANKGGYITMFAPNQNYQTENASVRVTARSVDGISPTSGFGLLVHGGKSTDTKAVGNYAFLIRTGDDPAYQVVQHKGATQIKLVDWTKSPAIRGGTNTNQLEVVTRNSVMTFSINGQYVTSFSGTSGLRGLVGFYSSDANEVAFDDLEISR